jgi:hypothetical protein
MGGIGCIARGAADGLAATVAVAGRVLVGVPVAATRLACSAAAAEAADGGVGVGTASDAAAPGAAGVKSKVGRLRPTPAGPERRRFQVPATKAQASLGRVTCGVLRTSMRVRRPS